MTSKGFNIFKWLIFIFGFCIIGLAYCFYGYGKELPKEKIYLWLNFIIVYSVFFFPIFFYGITLKNFDKHAPAVILIMKADIFFCLLSLALAAAVVAAYLALTAAVIIQCVLSFLFSALIFIALLTTSHIHRTEKIEEAKLNLIAELRSALELAALKSGGLPESYSEEKKKISDFAEDVRFISPVSDVSVRTLEQKILTKISELSDSCDSVIAGSNGAELKKNIESLALLISERKLKRN